MNLQRGATFGWFRFGRWFDIRPFDIRAGGGCGFLTFGGVNVFDEFLTHLFPSDQFSAGFAAIDFLLQILVELGTGKLKKHFQPVVDKRAGHNDLIVVAKMIIAAQEKLPGLDLDLIER